MLKRINLVPEESSTNKIWSIVYGSMAFLFVLVACLIYLMQQSAVSKIDAVEVMMKDAKQRQDSIALLQERLQNIRCSVDQQKKIMQKLSVEAARFDGIRNEKHLYSLVLRSIAVELPESVKCDNISIEKDTGSITGVTASYGELPEFVENLRMHDIYSAVTLQEIDQNLHLNSSVPYTFKIVFNLKPMTVYWLEKRNG